MAGPAPDLTAPAPIIVTAVLADRDFAWADALRRAHFPPDRNVLSAHLTLFHHLPPSAEQELRAVLAEEARDEAPAARLKAVISLGRGVAFAVESPALGAIRTRIADRFETLLIPQDRASWRPHITIQNKVSPQTAAQLHAQLSAGFRPRPIGIAGLALWHYRGGPWSPIARYMFNRSGRSRRS